MVGWITRSRVTNLLVSYVVTLLALIYFSTLIFYQLEHGPNPNVTNYGSAVPPGTDREPLQMVWLPHRMLEAAPPA